MNGLVKKLLCGVALIWSFSAAYSDDMNLKDIYTFGVGGQYGNGNRPVGELVAGQDGELYGVTEMGVGASADTGCYGVFYKIASNGAEADLYNFGTVKNDAENPRGGLMLSSDGSFYGTGSLGGKSGNGAIYKITMTNGVVSEQVVYSFSGVGDNGSTPDSALIEANGYLLGTTKHGGKYNNGTIFMLDKNGENFSTIYSFDANEGNINPKLTLTSNGDIFGVSEGSGNGNGIIYRLQPFFISNKLRYVFTIVHKFTNNDGVNPKGALTYQNNRLYGTTSSGGNNACGTIYTFESGVFNKIYDFNSGNGFYARGALLIEDGVIYGVSPLGGNYGYGSIYSYDLNTHKFSFIHSFNHMYNTYYNNGEFPMDGLTSFGGVLYGSAYRGGHEGQDAGTIFVVQNSK